MSEFVRARSREQKQLRQEEILTAAYDLFLTHTYHEITLTTIAEKLGWSRGNLYKYVTTKEEIFLSLYLRKQQNFYEDLESNLTIGSKETIAHALAELFDRHPDFLKVHSILSTILETNVSLESLTAFKKKLNEQNEAIIAKLMKCLSISYTKSLDLYWAFIYHAVGLYDSCHKSELCIQAMEAAGFPVYTIDFAQKMEEFILMCFK